jgi:signal transduction histidine kinase
MVFTCIAGVSIFIFQFNRKKVQYTDEKKLIQMLHEQEMARRETQIQLQTMEDIGSEIHDGVMQQLVLVVVQSNMLAATVPGNELREKAYEISKGINNAITDMRQLSKRLTRPETDTRSLHDLVHELCDKINALNFICIHSEFKYSVLEIAPTVKRFVYRILQEFTQNSMKHAECQNIWFTFEFVDNVFTVIAKDDGKGFSMDEYYANTNKGIGLMNMKKRSTLIGGNLSISSEADKGTQLTLSIPFEKLKY